MTPVKKDEAPKVVKEPKIVTHSPEENKQPEKPVIPGLPEEDRLKTNKKKKKKKNKHRKNEKPTGEIGKMSRIDFLICPETGTMKDDEMKDFTFSDNNDQSDSDDSSVESDGSDETFEDSKETFSDNEQTPAGSKVDDEFLTPLNLISTFARTLQAKTTSRPVSTSTPSSVKRPAGHHPDPKLSKKSRAQSQSLIPKKK